MNKFYYFEGRIFETLEAVEVSTKNYTNKQYEKINNGISENLLFNLQSVANQFIKTIQSQEDSN